MTAAVPSTAMARSGLVRRVIFAIARRDNAMRSLSKANPQPIKDIMNF